MPSSQASHINPNNPVPTKPLTVRCLGCGREFATEEVHLLGQTFAAERYCDVCREGEKAEGRAARRRHAVGARAGSVRVRRLLVRDVRAGARHRERARGVPAVGARAARRDGSAAGPVAAWQPGRGQDASRGRDPPRGRVERPAQDGAVPQRSGVAQRAPRELRRRRTAADSERLRPRRPRRPRRRALDELGSATGSTRSSTSASSSGDSSSSRRTSTGERSPAE